MTWSSFLPTFGVLFLIVMARANATYWIGRGAAAGTRRLRRLEEPSPRWRRAQRLVHRWGPVAVALCFLTVGVQTAVNATAGVARMPVRRYLPAVTVGSVIWAGLYATVGLAAARAWLAAAARWPATMTVLALLLAGGVGLLLWRRFRPSRDGDEGGATGAQAPGGEVRTRANDVRS